MSASVAVGTFDVPDFRTMVEKLKTVQWTEVMSAVMSGISGIGVIAMFILWLTGQLAGNTITGHDLSLINAKLSDLTSIVAKMQDRMDNGPRLDQMRDMDRHLSSIDGRIDGFEARLRLDEERLIRAMTMVDSIDAANKLKLGSH